MLNTIYLLRNHANNKVYVGQTWNDLETRSGSNGARYKNCRYLYRAIQKYGWQSFSYDILTVCSTQETADYWETYFIKHFNSCDSKRGYNIELGGRTGKKAGQHLKPAKKKLPKPTARQLLVAAIFGKTQ